MRKKEIFIYAITWLIFCFSMQGQTAYQKGWKAISEGNLKDAKSYFTKAVEDKKEQEKALLSLCILESRSNNKTKAGEYIKKYFETAKNPYPALFALWFDEGVIGENGVKEKHQLELLHSIYEQGNTKLRRAALNRLSDHYLFSNNAKTADKFAKELKSIQNWSVVGPFDNVVNSGFNKSFGALENPKENASFISKYGATVKWFVSPIKSKDGYYIKSANFLSDNSIVYAQSYVKAEEQREVILSFSYGGSIKLWINDQEVYSESSRRKTELEYFNYKLTLNKGFNRILVQLGDYEESYPYFNIIFKDTLNNFLDLPQKPMYQTYEEKLANVTFMKHFAIQHFQQQLSLNPDDELNKILLAQSYMRALDAQNAERIYQKILEAHPKHFIALYNLVLLYSKTGNATAQSRNYGIFEQTYPNSFDILTNQLNDAYQSKDLRKFEELLSVYNREYPDRYLQLFQEGRLAYLKEDYKKYIEIIEQSYKEFPEDYTAMTSEYNLQKSHYKNGDKAKKMLLDYLENNNNYNVIQELANTYLNEEKFDKAYKLYKVFSDQFCYDVQALKNMVTILSRQKKYAEAIELCKEILNRIPLEYNTTNDIALLAVYLGQKELALEYYQKSNEYFPFSFDTNEKIRELQGQKKLTEMIPSIDVNDIIKDYEAKMVKQVKMSYDIVFESKSKMIYKSLASAKKHEYIIRMNDEDAVEYWQQISFNTNNIFNTYINEIATIKPSGERVTADRENTDVVFTNLEIGDYIYVSYSEFQVNGGKTTRFIDDNFALNSVYPIYLREYNLLVEEGLSLTDTTLSNNGLKPEIKKENGVWHYRWVNKVPKPIVDENNRPNFNELTDKIHYTLSKSWDEIVQWYSDLSSHQASKDYTIEALSKKLFDDKDLSEEEKFKVIYDFVIENIQYSSVDFRQSNYIPQKASNTYHSRLGDCKDLSTLFVSLARASGLKANLVLINTDNSKKTVILPSLNFNHCIVKAYTESGSKYLELTSDNLPYGYLYYYHEGAPILEIPYGDRSASSRLEYLKYNSGYKNVRDRETQVIIHKDGSMKIKRKGLKTGIEAASMCNSYCDEDEKKLPEEIKEAISSDFNSEITIDEVHFDNLSPRQDSLSYWYSFTVNNDVIKLGSMRTVKIPYTDFLINMKAFKETDRKYDFNFPNYEEDDEYHEVIYIELPEGETFKNIPKNIFLEFNGNQYKTNFNITSSNKLKIERTYLVNRKVVKVEDYYKFKDFAEKVTEAENMQLLFE